MEDLRELKKETIKKLEELKENLSNKLTYDNYVDTINTLIDYDNEAQDNIYLYDHFQEMLEIVDDDTIQYLLESNNDCQRLFYLTSGIDYANDIYKVNDYGNLENVYDDDIEYCIDEAIDQLKEVL